MYKKRKCGCLNQPCTICVSLGYTHQLNFSDNSRRAALRSAMVEIIYIKNLHHSTRQQDDLVGLPYFDLVSPSLAL